MNARGTAEYIEELADLADPDKLWMLAGMDQMDLSPEKIKQVDAGVYLRRHASHIRRLHALIGSGKSLLITPHSKGVSSINEIETPPKIAKRGKGKP